MPVTIIKRNRRVKWIDGYPAVRIGGEYRQVRTIIQSGTDNPKVAKNASEEWLPIACVLSPHRSSGVANVCAHAGKCIETCLDVQGRGAAPGTMGFNIHAGRVARTVLFVKEQEYFLERMKEEIRRWQGKAERLGKRLCARLNTFSDIPWENLGIIDEFPSVQFYDYTKNPRRVGSIRGNYHVTFSRDSSADNDTCRLLLSQGKNVAVVYDDGRTTGGRNLHGPGSPCPTEWEGFPAIDGDITDARWTDPGGHAIMLRLKAHSTEEREKAISSGFAIAINQ